MVLENPDLESGSCIVWLTDGSHRGRGFPPGHGRVWLPAIPPGNADPNARESPVNTPRVLIDLGVDSHHPARRCHIIPPDSCLLLS